MKDYKTHQTEASADDGVSASAEASAEGAASDSSPEKGADEGTCVFGEGLGGKLSYIASVETLTEIPAETSAEASAEESSEESIEVLAAEWLVEGLLPRRGVAVLGGPINAGKTITSLQISLCVATGLPVFGRRLFRQGPVIHVIAQSSQRSLATWLAPLTEGLGITKTTNLPLYLVDANPVLKNNDFSDQDRDNAANALLSQIEDMCAEIKPALVIFDGSFTPLGSLEIKKDARLIERLQTLAEANDGLILVTAHTPKKVSSLTDLVYGRGIDTFFAEDINALLLIERHLAGRICIRAEFSDRDSTDLWLQRDLFSLVARPDTGPITATKSDLIGLLVEYSQTAGLVRPEFAQHYANRVIRALREFAKIEKRDLSMSEGRRYVLLRQTDAMGLTPVKDPEALSLFASALEITDLDSLIRLLWVINRDTQQDFADVKVRWSPMASEALNLIGRKPAPSADEEPSDQEGAA